MYISSQLSPGLLNRTLAERFLLAETLVGVGSVASMDAGSSNCHTHLRSCIRLYRCSLLSVPCVHYQLLYEDSQMVTLTAPYISGFLAFRETPYLLEALQRLETTQPSLLPQVVLVDGNGLFHYREFGLACHLGVLSGLPCIGVAKNLLQVQGVEKNEKHQSQIASLQKGGESFPLTSDSGKVLGKALRSSDSSTKPVYVSVGHKISLDTALRLTHSCCRYRVPEPIRQADMRSREYLRVHFPTAADT
ncbi:unnamed protein product [Oncorhynchus mykiss]|uniref:Endonuclease V n=1 Tax=Oncorhynchus mykiss TaxID=8022 RepID=A0A060WP16_ONCMY|nr:unnamed protein product [Oncorhynchus mykiss]